jgi:3,4-dihydroxy 2-butanone 4-phosphate synthase/GTP cyclohydrolase II
VTPKDFLSPIEDIIDDARNGRMFILVDDEERENEGDLVIPAQMATPEAINFMAKNGRGLICLALTPKRVLDLELPLMKQLNASRHQTAFTVSIEAMEGVTTGISASDRARTIQVAIDPMKGKADIGSPGHVFPLEARDGGVLVRTGHTEASVDVARLAGLNLMKFSQVHGLNVGTIADLIAYRLKHDRIVEPVLETVIDSVYGGEFRVVVYKNKVAFSEHIALIKGDIDGEGPLPVRMHALNVVEDVLGDNASGRATHLHRSMRMISKHGRGVIVLIREPQPTMVSDFLRSRTDHSGNGSSQLRDYGVGAQILLDLGVRDMILLSNTQRTLIGLEGYNLSIVERREIPKDES